MVAHTCCDKSLLINEEVKAGFRLFGRPSLYLVPGWSSTTCERDPRIQRIHRIRTAIIITVLPSTVWQSHYVWAQPRAGRQMRWDRIVRHHWWTANLLPATLKHVVRRSHESYTLIIWWELVRLTASRLLVTFELTCELDESCSKTSLGMVAIGLLAWEWIENTDSHTQTKVSQIYIGEDNGSNTNNIQNWGHWTLWPNC